MIIVQVGRNIQFYPTFEKKKGRNTFKQIRI